LIKPINNIRSLKVSTAHV